MIIGTLYIKLYAPWVHSLKEKRMVVKSIIAKTGNKFNVSIAEVGDQDLHQSIVIGVACVTNETSQADSILDTVLKFIESNTEAELVSVERQII